MAMQIFQTQISDSKEFAGLVTNNHMGWLGMREPSKLTNDIEAIYKYGSSGEDFISFVNRFPVKEVPNDSVPHRWMMAGATEKNIPLVGASSSLSNAQSGTYASGTDKLGQYGASVYLVFAERYFSNTHVLTGPRPKAFSVRVMSEPVQSGSKWIYECKLYGARYGADFFIPLEDVAAGTRWAANFSPVSQTLSRNGSEPTYNSYYSFENNTSMIRKKLMCAGNMLNVGGATDPIRFTFVATDENGQTKQWTKWIDYQMWRFIQSFRADQARLLLFGRSTVDPETGAVNMKDPDSGYEIKAGLGFYEQISPSSRIRYTDFSLRQLENILMELSYNKRAMDDRKFTILTGEYGAMQFYRAARNEAAAIPFMLNNQLLNYDGKGMGTFKVGAINTYMWYQGIEVTVIVDPTKDNGIINSVKHPDGGFMSSYEYDIIDSGSFDGKSNIYRLGVANMKEQYSIIRGLRDPFRPGGGLSAPNDISSPIDGYEIHGAYWGGLTITNPGRVAQLVPAYLY